MENLNLLVQKYANRGEQTNIAIGLRPSGVIHLGNLSSLGLAGIVGGKIGPHLSNVGVTICDLDMPDSREWSMKEHGYVRYFNSLPSKNPNETLLQHAMTGISKYLGGLESYLGVRFNIKMLSDIQREEKFRTGLKKVLDTPEIMQFLHSGVEPGKVLVFPICSQCKTSNPHQPAYRDGKILTSCTNPECSVEEYEMDVMDCNRDLAVHFFIDPLRDRTVKPYADIHVFGGDYSEEHENSKIRKIDKIARVTHIASGSNPDIIIGPTFYARDGSKMSKSKNNGLSVETLEQHFGSDYHIKILDFLNRIVSERFSHVDYALVEKYLLNPVETSSSSSSPSV